MDSIEGPTLEAYVAARAPLPLAEALELLRQIFRSVADAHASGVANRDLKPGNVVIGEADGGPHLRIVWPAPEQGAVDATSSPESDVLGLGLIAFFVLTGRNYEPLGNPSERPSVRATALGVERELPGGFDDWFLRAVAPDPAARFEDATAALVELTRVLDERAKDRLSRWFPVEIDDLPGGVAMAHDVSDTGMQVVARGTLELDAEVTIKVELPPGSGRVFERRARVVRSGTNRADPEGLWPMQLAFSLAEPITNVAELLRGLRLP